MATRAVNWDSRVQAGPASQSPAFIGLFDSPEHCKISPHWQYLGHIDSQTVKCLFTMFFIWHGGRGHILRISLVLIIRSWQTWACFKAEKVLYWTRESMSTRESKGGGSTSPKSWTRSSTSGHWPAVNFSFLLWHWIWIWIVEEWEAWEICYHGSQNIPMVTKMFPSSKMGYIRKNEASRREN